MLKAISAAMQTTHDDVRWLAAFNDGVLVRYGPSH
jgi:hypothetical protein